MLCSTLILLPCLLFIRLLPLLPLETIFCTLGLSHINPGSEISYLDLTTTNISYLNLANTNLTDNLNLGSGFSGLNLTCKIPSCAKFQNTSECTGGCHTYHDITFSPFASW